MTGADRLLVAGCCVTLLAGAGYSGERSTGHVLGQKVPPGENAHAQYKELLWWLPADTETIEVADVSQELPNYDPAAEAEGKLQLHERLRQGLIDFPLAQLAQVDHGTAYKILNRRKILLTLQGSRRFKPPRGLGEMPFEGCEIAVFETSLGEVGASFGEALGREAQRIEQIVGQTVFEFDEKLEEDHWTIFIGQPKPDILVVATNRAYLEEVLQRIATRASTRALPDNLPEWHALDPQAKVWAIRHFDRAGAKTDPTSPFSGPHSFSGTDAEAIGVVYSFDRAETMAHVRYLSRNENAREIVRKLWVNPAEGLTPEIVQTEPGIVDISVSLKSEKTAAIFFFVLYLALGHGIYL